MQLMNLYASTKKSFQHALLAKSVKQPSVFKPQDTQIVRFKASEEEGECQGVKEMRFSGDTLLTGVLLLERGANRSADGVSI